MENKNDDLIFEISDGAYLYSWLVEIVLVTTMALLLYFDPSDGINDSFGRTIVIYGIVFSKRKFYEFFIKKDKKLF